MAIAILVIALAAPAALAERKQLMTAQAFSGVGTGVSGALFLTAFLLSKRNEGDINMPLVYVSLGTSVVTPALGHWYAGRYLTPGMGVRAAAALFATWGVVHYSQTQRCNTLEFKECTGLKREAIVVLGLSAIAFVGGAAYDFKTLHESVDAYNARFAITPTIMPTTSGPPGAGLVLVGEF
ncbi:MAG: hypothetical protein H0T42_03675 [Deltaproteobacteria bacterium]|nr:hypothetical protein [Deltaproteobacteria bacterium]